MIFAKLSSGIFVIACGLVCCQTGKQLIEIFSQPTPRVVRAVSLPSNNELLATSVYLPESSIINNVSNQHYVLVKRDGQAQAQPVTVGEKIGNLRQVFGLQPGEIVILENDLKVSTPVFTQIINYDASAEAGSSGQVL